MDLLVVGGSGLLGREVVRQARRAGSRVVATYHRGGPGAVGVDWLALDIRRRGDVAALVERVRPAMIVNAAYQQADWVTTADGATHVAAAAAAVGARLVHVSSDAVFSGLPGRGDGPARRGAGSARPDEGPARADAGPVWADAGPVWAYDETCVPDPITAYGAAKAAAETAVKGLDPGAAIARTSLIIGDGDSAQEAFVHALASGATDGVLFTDDVRCPIHVADLAAALLEFATSPYSGIHHVAGADAVSRHELGVLIARRDGLDEGRLRAGLRAGSGIPGGFDVRLDCRVTQSRLTVRLRGAHEFLAPVVPS